MKIAFAGAGYNNKILPKAAAVKDSVELVGVADRFSSTTAGFVEEYGKVRRFEKVEKMLNAIKPDILVVGAPNYLHASPTFAALKSGVHVMVEKPIAMNASEAH
jgi:predicted dehydrogenase